MPDEILISLRPDSKVIFDIVPGTTFTLQFKSPLANDWRLYDLYADILPIDGVAGVTTPLARINSDDDEITVDGTDRTEITATWSATKTDLLAGLSEVEFDILAVLKSDATIRLAPFPLGKFRIINRRTHVD